MKTILKEEDLLTATRIKRMRSDSVQDYWPLAKPENARLLSWRIKAAWHVLKGDAVPIEWF